MHEILHSRRFRDRRESVMVVIYLVRRVGGGHHDDDVTFRRSWPRGRREKIPIFIGLDDNGWLNGLFSSPKNRCGKRLIRVESVHYLGVVKR